MDGISVLGITRGLLAFCQPRMEGTCIRLFIVR